MRRLTMFLTVCGFGALAGFAAVAEESLEEAAAAIDAAWQKVGALEADMRIDATMPMGADTMKLEGTGHAYYLREGDTGKYRQEMTIKLPPPIGGETKHTAIFDGNELYLINEMAGQYEVQKAASNDFSKGAAPPGGKPLLDALSEGLDLKRLPDAELEGTPVFVFEGTPEAGGPAGFEKMMLYVDKEYGVQRKMEIVSGPGEPSVTIAWTSLEHDPEIDAALFSPDKK